MFWRKRRSGRNKDCSINRQSPVFIILYILLYCTLKLSKRVRVWSLTMAIKVQKKHFLQNILLDHYWICKLLSCRQKTTDTKKCDKFAVTSKRQRVNFTKFHRTNIHTTLFPASPVRSRILPKICQSQKIKTRYFCFYTLDTSTTST